MILATVGTQLPFFRFIKALDQIARNHDLDIVAQTCKNYDDAERIKQQPFLSPETFETMARQADLIVGHAGIGTILSAERLNKPLVLFPRIASLGEHRNEHQLATAKAMSARQGIYVAWNEEELRQHLTNGSLVPMTRHEAPTKAMLISEIASFIKGKSSLNCAT